MQELGQYDIAIIGLGVAGSNLATRLSKRFKVIAIDKKHNDGDCFDKGFHKPCGGLLSQGAQKAFAKQGIAVPHDVLTHPQLFAVNTIDYGFPHASYIQKCYVNMERHRFDLWLKSRIPPHIDVWHNAVFKRIYKRGDGIYELEFKNMVDSVFMRCQARVVVGSDGANSHIRAFAYPYLRIPFLICIQAWFREENTPMLSCIFDKSLTNSYSWSMSKEGYFIFGGAYPYKKANQRFEIQLTRLKELGFKFGDMLKKEACWVLQPQRLGHIVRGHSGIFLIGEAAGFINASTLEGISGAMNSSRILGEILNAMLKQDTQQNALQSINIRFHNATRFLAFKTLIRHYVRYPFMFVKILRRCILRFKILRVKAGLINGRII